MTDNSNLPHDIQSVVTEEKLNCVILEKLNPEEHLAELNLLPSQVKPVWDKIVYAFTLGSEFGFISCGEFISKNVQEIYPETKDELKDVFNGYTYKTKDIFAQNKDT